MNGEYWSVVLNIVVALAVFVFFFSASVFFHELGHFLAARWRGLVVDKFAIGFPPIIWKRKINGVEWCLGATPFGGFVSLPQLAGVKAIEGESDARHLPEISWIDKIIVSVAGPVFSMLFAFLLGCLLWVTKLPESEAPNVIGFIQPTVTNSMGVEVESPALKAGLKVDDVVVSVDGEAIENYDDLRHAIVLGRNSTEKGDPRLILGILREGRPLSVEVFPVLRKEGIHERRLVGIAGASDVFVYKCLANSPAEAAGFLPKDQILTWNGTRLKSLAQLDDLVTALPKDSATPVRLGILRDGKPIELAVAPAMMTYDTAGNKKVHLGIIPQPFFEPKEIRRTPWERIGKCLKRTHQTLAALLSPGSSVDATMVNGPAAMAQGVYYLAQVDLRYVVSLFLMINVSLAIFNMLPLPVLDGGHITVAVLTKLRGKQLPESFMGYLQSAFVVMFLGLMLFVFFNDSRSIAKDVKEHINEPKPLAVPIFEPLPVK